MKTIEQIIEMDKTAQSYVAEAVERERRRISRSDEQVFLQNQTALDAERKEADEAVSTAQQRLSEKLQAAEKTRTEQCGRLDEIFNEHKAQWKAEILGRITGG